MAVRSIAQRQPLADAGESFDDHRLERLVSPHPTTYIRAHLPSKCKCVSVGVWWGKRTKRHEGCVWCCSLSTMNDACRKGGVNMSLTNNIFEVKYLNIKKKQNILATIVTLFHCDNFLSN